MTYNARVADDGSVAVPEALARAIGAGPGASLSIEQDGRSLVLRLQTPPTDALARLRRAMDGYSVERFLAERRADWGE